LPIAVELSIVTWACQLEGEGMDTQTLKERCDLRRVVEQDLGPAPKRGGRAYLWRCPFHGEKRGYSFAVWADGFRCFGRCDKRGDVLDWLQEYRRLRFNEALAVLGQPFPERSLAELTHQPRVYSEPPPTIWQTAAREVAALAEETLWSTAGENALAYLTGRGLTAATIRKAGLGYVPGDWRERRSIAGLEVPCGITLPWFAADALWAVKVRRAYGMPKYVQITGSSASGLYGADTLANADAALFCEGEFDALIAGQEVGNLVTAVTLGSAVNTLSRRWLGELVGCQTLLVAYDSDEAGIRGAQRLARISPRFRRIDVPHGKDITDFYLSGGDVYGWIETALETTMCDSGKPR
jgi:DNA primase